METRNHLNKRGVFRKARRVGKFNTIHMKNFMTILGAIIIVSFIMVSCGQNSNKQKELELREREVALKEKELALKERDSTNLKTSIKETAKKDAVQETIKMSADTKILTLMSPTYVLGDLPHITFKDFTTHEEKEYECNWDLPAIREILTKCEDHEGCPALKGQVYSATLKLKLLDAVEYNVNTGAEEPTGKKEKRWVMVALQKINKPN